MRGGAQYINILPYYIDMPLWRKPGKLDYTHRRHIPFCVFHTIYWKCFIFPVFVLKFTLIYATHGKGFMPLFIFVAAVVTAVTSFLFYLISGNLNLYKKRHIIVISVLNILFCASFPLLFALVSGESGNGMPSRGLGTVFIVMAIWTFIYLTVIIWRVALRSSGVRLIAPLPEPLSAPADMDITGKLNENIPDIYGDPAILSDSKKDSVDTDANIDKMGIVTENQQRYENEDVNSLVNQAFDCLSSGNLEEAAEYFYSAIDKHPPLNLEVQIAIQLSMVYCELGKADLSYDILVVYKNQYRSRLTDEDKKTLDTAFGIVDSIVAGNGGDGYEKN
jgi:hypothetical protein